MSYRACFNLLWRNRFAVGPTRIGMAFLMLFFFAPINFALGLIQKLRYGREIARTEIREQPIFVIGHWRSGTTLLHELLTLDDRHTFPSTYDCFAPHHFLISTRVTPALVRRFSPKQRPQDNMPLELERPQEDEFALCNLGMPSPYLTIAFPNRPPQNQEFLTLEDVPPEDLARWKRTLLWFLKCVTLRDPKRIVLKSPPHTARIRVLMDLFPDARFVHIVRDPYVLFPSTVTLWKRFYKRYGLHVPKYAGLEDHVFETLNRMYDAFERAREFIPPGHLCQVRFEELVADPVGQVRQIYQELGLADFDRVLPTLQEYVAAHAGHQPNRYEISAETRAEISRRWRPYIERYGYGSEPAESEQPPAEPVA
jgi:hypothetical protein